MEVNLDETERPVVVLREYGTGFQMPNVQRIAVAALALETYDQEVIGAFLGIDELEVAYVLCQLLRNGWNTMGVLEQIQDDQRISLTQNANCYAILKKKGITA